MATPFSHSGSYLSAAEFLLRADWRPVGRLCSDNNAGLTATELLTDPKLAAALLDASGQVEAVALVGKRYTPTTLAALTGAGQGLLFRLVARLAVCLLWERRMSQTEPPPVYMDQVYKDLEALRLGTAIFGVLENAESGLVSHHVETSTEIAARNLRTFQARRFFGRRSDSRDSTFNSDPDFN